MISPVATPGKAPARRVAGWQAVLVPTLLLVCAPAGAVDLEIVTFLQDDLTDYMPGATLDVPAVPGIGQSDLTGPIAYYEYDDCHAQLGLAGGAATGEINLVLDYGALNAKGNTQGIVLADGISVWIDGRDYQAASMTLRIAQPDDRGAALYLLKRLAGLCRSSH